jgi:2,4-dienoyl-CoA reductase-like NADH-dependent reductase (Old Yellow Enzyme family)
LSCRGIALYGFANNWINERTIVTILETSLDLPCGVSIPNRLAKSAMTEGLADPYLRATPELNHVYKRWALGGIGLNITGNVQVDITHLERPGNVVIDGNGGLDELRAYAEAGKTNGTELWMQINHPGRQCPASINPHPYAPSDVQLGHNDAVYGKPIPMSHDQVIDMRDRFVDVAKTAQDTGFNGVQIHAAHGYLLSNFLSPVTNKRIDQWGGTLENRARLLVDIVRSTREEVGKDYPISVKMNSTDFQQGGFTLQDCQQVVAWLSDATLDLLEISGGTYEQPAMMGGVGNAATYEDPLKESTAKREAYFVEYAKAIQPAAAMPLMVTGGFRTREAMEHAVGDGSVDLVGIARPLCGDPESPGKLLRGEIEALPDYENMLNITEADAPDLKPHQRAAMEGAGRQGWFCLNIIRMGHGLEADMDLSCMEAAAAYVGSEAATNEKRLAALG